LFLQAAVAVALFADSSWCKYLPPDETGEFKKARAALQRPIQLLPHPARFL
jgi:hypothetical protein